MTSNRKSPETLEIESRDMAVSLHLILLHMEKNKEGQPQWYHDTIIKLKEHKKHQHELSAFLYQIRYV